MQRYIHKCIQIMLFKICSEFIGIFGYLPVFNIVGWQNKLSIDSSCLKDNLPHNTCQIYVKPHSKNTQMTLEYHIFDEKALE